MKFNVDSFWPRVLLLALVDLVVVLILLLFKAGGGADYSVVYGTLVSLVAAVGVEFYFSTKHDRRFSPAELLGAGIFGSIAMSFLISLVLYFAGIIV